MERTCWLVEIDAALPQLQGSPPAAVTVTLRYATRELVTRSTDNPPKRPIQGRLRFPAELIVKLPNAPDGRIGSTTEAALAEIQLENTDREMDEVLEQHVFDGRVIRVKSAPMRKDEHGWPDTPALAEFSLFFTGRIQAHAVNAKVATLRVESDTARMRKRLCTLTYAGTGGIEGPEELKGRVKPVGLGFVRGAEPVLIDSFKGIFQCSGHSILEMVEVLDGAYPLEAVRDYATYADLEAATTEGEQDPEDPSTLDPDIRIGEFATCAASGCFRLGGLPAGRVTVTFRGYGDFTTGATTFDDGTIFDDGTEFVGRTGIAYAGATRALIRRVLLDFAGISGSLVDDDQILDFDGSADPSAGIYDRDGELTVGDALARLAASIACVISEDADGMWRLKKIALPEPADCFVLKEPYMAMNSLQKLASPFGQPWAKWRVGAKRNQTVLSEGEIFPGAPSSERNFASRPYEYSEASSPVLLALHPEAKTGEIETPLTFNSDAQVLADHFISLYGPRPDGRMPVFRRVQAQGIGGQIRLLSGVILDLGDTTTVVVTSTNVVLEENSLGEIVQTENASGTIVQWVNSGTSTSSQQTYLVTGVTENPQRETTDLELFG